MWKPWRLYIAGSARQAAQQSSRASEHQSNRAEEHHSSTTAQQQSSTRRHRKAVDESREERAAHSVSDGKLSGVAEAWSDTTHAKNYVRTDFVIGTDARSSRAGLWECRPQQAPRAHPPAQSRSPCCAPSTPSRELQSCTNGMKRGGAESPCLASFDDLEAFVTLDLLCPRTIDITRAPPKTTVCDTTKPQRHRCTAVVWP